MALRAAPDCDLPRQDPAPISSTDLSRLGLHDARNPIVRADGRQVCPVFKRIFHGKIPAPIRRTRQTRERLALKRQAQQPAPKAAQRLALLVYPPVANGGLDAGGA